MSEPFKIWVTRWVLNRGIEECTASPFPGREDLVVCRSGYFNGAVLQHGDWHKTRAAAVKEANKVLSQAKAKAKARVEELDSVTFEERSDVEREQVS